MALLAVVVVLLGVRFWDPTRARAYQRGTSSSASS